MNSSAFSLFKGGVTGDDFIGRKKELDFLISNLCCKNPSNIAIYGLPHVGKTSLLMECTRIIRDMSLKTVSGKSFILVEQTADVEYGSIYFVRSIVRGIYRQIVEIQGDLDSQSVSMLLSKMKELIQARDGSFDSMMSIWIESMIYLTEHDYRTVISIDEFERIGQKWTEDEYISFIMPLLDKHLDLICIVASRPHISYIVSDYTQKIIPFKPFMLSPFSDDDMDTFFRKVHQYSNKDYRTDSLYGELNEILYSCGRNPYLLSLLASRIIDNPEKYIREIYNDLSHAFDAHFKDVIKFMQDEEIKEQKSFSHIIKCYFGVLADYSDILQTYIRLGYIEKFGTKSKYTYECDRYVIEEESSGQSYSFMTVCPAFINYLYSNELDEIKDIRDLITGLIHSLRDITKYELEKEYGIGVTGWNKAILERFYYDSLDKRTNNRVSYYAQYDSNTQEWDIRSEYLLDNDRKIWIKSHQNEMIKISKTSLQFAKETFNEKENQVMPVLDPISIVDNGRIICGFPHLFSKYFSSIGDLSDYSNKKRFEGVLRDIQEARNEVSHFDRHGGLQKRTHEYSKLCIDLLKDIYTEYRL